MRIIDRTGAFKRDFKRVKAMPKHRDIDTILVPVFQLLLTDQALPPRFCDHALTGNWKDHRDCHIKPDLVLIYRKTDDNTLQLIRLGSHSELGL